MTLLMVTHEMSLPAGVRPGVFIPGPRHEMGPQPRSSATANVRAQAVSILTATDGWRPRELYSADEEAGLTFKAAEVLIRDSFQFPEKPCVQLLRRTTIPRDTQPRYRRDVMGGCLSVSAMFVIRIGAGRVLESVSLLAGRHWFLLTDDAVTDGGG
jgi:hypothetical protein